MSSNKKIFTSTTRTIAIVGLFCWFIFVVVSLSSSGFLLKAVLGFPLLIGLPGFLFLTSVHVKHTIDWFYVCLTVGLSVIILMIVGLLANFLLPLIDVVPLRSSPLLVSVTAMLVILSVVPVVKVRTLSFKIPRLDNADYFYFAIAIATVVTAVLGALRLNNGYSGSLTLCMLCAMMMLFVGLFNRIEKISNGVLATVLYLTSLALLLMTSLRGWGIVGHDVQREFSVFELTKDAGVWSLTPLRDAYDACISISILPTLFAELLSVPDAYVYKVLFQIIFAFVSVASFILFSKYFSKFIAVLSTIIFISFPTFFSDMPMLNRQEIAFLLFIVLVLVCFDTQIVRGKRNALVAMLGAGIVFSHYSTTYIVILFISTALCGFWMIKLLLQSRQVRKYFRKHALKIRNYTVAFKPVIPIPVLLFLIVLSFSWSSVITHTSQSSITKVLMRTIAALSKDSDTTKSNDTTYSVFPAKKLTNSEILGLYKTDVVDKMRSSAPANTYFSESDVTNFVPEPAEIKNLQLTKTGTFLQNAHINVETVNATLKFGTAQLLQVLLLLGMVSSLFVFCSKYFRRKPKIEYLFLSLAGVILLASMVLIPVLSVEYGVLRAFQQTLLLAAPFIVIGSMILFSVFGEKLSRAFSVAFVMLFFLVSTGVVTQLLGGYKAQLHLDNAGPYYDFFYIHASETSALEWVTEQGSKSVIQSESQTGRYVSKTVNEHSPISTIDQIYPGLMRKNSFILLDYSNIYNGYSIVSFNGVSLPIKYPIDLTAKYKNKVYDSEGAIIYR